MTIAWTEERIERLRNLWEEGLTASQIAENMGGVSRNAVIGKAHRLGLKSRPSPVKSGDGKRKKAKDSAVKPVSQVPAETKSVDAAPTALPVARVASPQATPDSKPVKSTTPITLAPGQLHMPAQPRLVSVGPGGFVRQAPGEQQPPIPPAPPRRLVPARPSVDIADKTSLLDLNERVCKWPMGHPGEPDFHFCGKPVNPNFPYCVEHCGRAYQAQLPRGTRRAPPPTPFGNPRVR